MTASTPALTILPAPGTPMNTRYVLVLTSLLALLGGCTASGSEGENPRVNSSKSSHKTDGDEHGHDDEAAHDRVQLTPSALKRSGIRVDEVRRAALASALSLPAQIEFDPDLVAHISTFIDGQITDVQVRVGDKVTRGQTLATLRSMELGQARAAMSSAQAAFEVAQTNYERQQNLFNKQIGSELSMLEARAAFLQARSARDAAQSNLKVLGTRAGSGTDLVLKSPIAGTIQQRKAVRGESVQPGDDLFVVADLSRVWIVGRAAEQQVAQLQTGMGATLTLTAYPGRTWHGKVDYISAVLDPDTRTVDVRLELENPDGELRPGLYGTLWLNAQSSSEAGATQSTLVPSQAVQVLNGRSIVFVPGDAPGEFVATAVTVGHESGGQTELVQSSGALTSVVVDGAFILKSELMRGELGEGHAH